MKRSPKQVEPVNVTPVNIFFFYFYVLFLNPNEAVFDVHDNVISIEPLHTFSNDIVVRFGVFDGSYSFYPVRTLCPIENV